MKSETPKPLHPVAGLPMIEYVLRAAEALNPGQIIVVASRALEAVLRTEAPRDFVDVVVQDPPRGTGDAVLSGLQRVEASKTVLILYADHPLVSPEDLGRLIGEFHQRHALAGVMTCVVDNAAGYGRIARNTAGAPVAIIEKVDDEPSMRQGPTEINSGIMALDRRWATKALRALPPNPRKNEVFLTDLVAAAAGETASPCPVVAIPGSPDTLIGVNDRADLAVADHYMRSRIRAMHMDNGVTIVGPDTVFIDSGVDIGPDTTILPFSMLLAGTSVGERCTIGPQTTLERVRVGDESRIEYSVVRDSVVGPGCHVGPFSHLRNGTKLDEHVHIGNYVEAKNAQLASGVRAGHVTYLGDASIGESTNIGAGTVTCNFDGVDKHHTTIGANVFIGSDSMLVAPLTIGDGATTGAGSVVTRDVEPGAKVVGIPARPIRRRGDSANSHHSGSKGE